MKPAKDYINLLPREKKKEHGPWGPWLAALAVFVFAWGIVLGLTLRQRSELQDRLDAVLAQKKNLEQQLASVRAGLGLTAVQGASPERAALIQKLLSERVLWSKVFLQFSRIVPKGLWFDSLEGKTDGNAQITIRGGAFSYLTISEFMLAMEKSDYFEKPQLYSAQKSSFQGQDYVSFEIACGVKKDQGGQ